MYEIIIGKGLSEIYFGDYEGDIIKKFGNPDKTKSYEYPDGTDSITLQYFDLDIYFSLSPDENYRLTDILIYGQDFHIDGVIRIGINKTKLLEASLDLNFGEYRVEDSSTLKNPTHELISFDKIAVNFWFDYGKLSSIQVGTLWKDENTIDWPK